MFGIDYDSMSSQGIARDIMSAIDVVSNERAMKQLFNPLRYFMFWNKDVREATVACKFIEKSQLDILTYYRATHTPEQIEKDQGILAHLVRSPYPNDTMRCADMTVFMIAGQDTTSNSMGWILCEVAKNPDILLKIQTEIDSVVGKNDETITTKQLGQMPYLDKVIKEGARLWPVVQLGVARVASKDIPYKDYIIPKGAMLWMPFCAIFKNGIQVNNFRPYFSSKFFQIFGHFYFCFCFFIFTFFFFYFLFSITVRMRTIVGS